MNFLRKLATYMLGVGLGVIMVYFIFGDRDIQCNYFPNDRVLYDLRKKELQYSESVAAQMQANSLNDSVVMWALERGKVDFEQSQTEKEPCKEYFIELKEPAYQMNIRNCDSVATVLELKKVK